MYGVKRICLSVCDKRLFDLSPNQNQKPFEKKITTLAARAVIVSLFFPQKMLIFDFLAGNNFPDLPYSQGVCEI